MTASLSNRAAEGLGTVLLVIRLGRPKFLLGGAALFGLGTLVAIATGHGFRPAAFLLGLLAVTTIQLMTHYSNDYFDMEADRANRTPTRWSGGSRVLVRGELPRWSALLAALVLCVVACLVIFAMLYLPHVPGALTLALFGGTLILSWSYSSPPLRLHSRGLGELTVAAVVPLLTPVCGYFLQAGAVHLRLMPLLAPLVVLQLVMLLTVQIPDADGDRRVNKRTWTVLFGTRPIALLCSGLIPLAFVLGLCAPVFGLPRMIQWMWLLLTPLGAHQVLCYLRRFYQMPHTFNRVAFGSVALFFLAIVGDLVGFAALLGAEETSTRQTYAECLGWGEMGRACARD